jgi:hypothetical protein
MDAETLDLSRRLTAHPRGPKPPQTTPCYGYGCPRDEAGCRWRPVDARCPECNGTGYVEVPDTDSGESACFSDCNQGHVVVWALDLTDDATGGSLLGMLWSADPSLHIHRDGDGVIVHLAPGVVEHVAPSLGAAVASALLACWAADRA